MKPYISHRSALAFWRSDYALYGETRQCRVRSLDNATASIKDLAFYDLQGERFGNPPLDLLVNSANKAHTDDRRIAHVWNGRIPSDAFVMLSDGICVASPELTFMQCAARQTQIESILLGYELCGGYSLRPETPEGFVRHEPLTTVARIKDFAMRLRAPMRPTKAERILQYVHDSAASPAESALAMRLVLPLRMGGSSLNGIQLNAEVPVTGQATKLTSSRSLFCDVYVPAHHVDIEYDSYAYHTGRQKLAEDSERRMALASLGITVVTVTTNQLYSLDRFAALANQIRRLCGKRPFEQTLDRKLAQDRLCDMILSEYKRRYVG